MTLNEWPYGLRYFAEFVISNVIIITIVNIITVIVSKSWSHFLKSVSRVYHAYITRTSYEMFSTLSGARLVY